MPRRVERLLVAAACFVVVGGSAFAAEPIVPQMMVPAMAPVVVAPAAFSWQGCYVGVIAGYGRGNSYWDDPIIGEFSHDQPRGWLAGGEVGCNFTAGALVFGIEGDLAWANFRDAKSHATPDPDEWTDTTTYHAIATVTGRVGFAFNRTMIYAEAGFALARVTLDDTGINPSGPYQYATTQNRRGYVVGGGIEHALNDNWSIKFEYNYMNFGTATVDLQGIDIKPGQPIETVISALSQSVFKFGLNYRF